MKLVTFTHQATTRLGIISGDQVVDLAAASPHLPARDERVPQRRGRGA